MLPFLTDAEVDELVAPLKQPAAQCRALQRMGLSVLRKPNGRAVVARSEFERVIGADRLGRQAQNPAVAAPNIVGLRQWARGRDGAKAQGR